MSSIESERDSASTARRERAEQALIEHDATETTYEDPFVAGYLWGASDEAARAAEKLRAAAREMRTPFGEALAHLADEIEEGR